MEMIILRGLPSSGKTTFAKKLTDYVVCESDDYFYKDGNYEFDMKKLKFAHMFCYNKARKAIQDKKNVCISNTNIQESDFKKYIDLAERNNYTVTSIIVENRHGNKNDHNVPKDTIENMRKNFKVKLWTY